jgi:hypothetical protein
MQATVACRLTGHFCVIQVFSQNESPCRLLTFEMPLNPHRVTLNLQGKVVGVVPIPE